MKKTKFLVIALVLFLLGSFNAQAFQCQQGRVPGPSGSSDSCWSSVTGASNETNLVSAGTVLVFDVNSANNQNTTEDHASYLVRTSTASANGIFVAGVAQENIASGGTALILVRGKGSLHVLANQNITSGNALFVSASGTAAIVTSTTQNQLAVSLDDHADRNTTERDSVNAYITIV